MAKRLKIEEALDYCLLNPEGLSDEQLLAKFPQYREQLYPLLVRATSVQAAVPPSVPIERMAAIKQRLLDAAASGAVQRGTAVVDLNATPHRVEEPRPERQPRQRRGWALPMLSLPRRRIAWTGAIAAVVLVAFTWWAAATSLADSPFYDVKLASENLMVDLTMNPADRARAHAQLVTARIEDVRAMAAAGKMEQAGKALDNFDYHINSGLNDLDQVQGEQRTEIAMQLYTSSLEGAKAFGGLKDNPKLPLAVKDNLERALADTSTLNNGAAQALTGAGVDPGTIPTPRVSPVAIVTPTPGGGQVVAINNTPTSGSTSGQTTAVPSTIASSPPPVVPGTAGAPTSTTEAKPSPTVPAAAASPTKPSVGGTPNARPTATWTSVPARSTPTAGGAPPVNTPTSTTVPPSATPSEAVPTHTPEPTSTAQATYTQAPATATATATPVPSLCDLVVAQVAASCASQSCVNWSARVTNPDSGSVEANWTAELQISQRGGGFETVASAHGSQTFSPGETSFQGSLCYTFPPETNNIRVEFTLDNPDFTCHPHAFSDPKLPCVPDATSTPRPTNTPRPTRTPRP